VTLRMRISIFVFCAVLLLTGGILFGEADRIDLLSERVQALTLENQVAAWEQAVDTETTALSSEIPIILGLPGLDLAAQAKDTVALQKLLAPVAASGAVSRIDMLDEDGNLLYSSDPDTNSTPLVDAGLVYKIMADNSVAGGLERSVRGHVLATSAKALSVNQVPVGVLVLADDLSRTINQLKTTTGNDIVLLDLAGRPVLSTAPATLWHDIAAKLGPLRPGLTDITLGNRVLRLGVTVISSGSGNRIGYEAAVTDFTQTHQHDRSRQIFSYLIILVFVAGIQIALFRYLSRTFRPLSDSMTALNALAGGDTSVDIVGEERHDEVGRLAQLTRIVRDLKRADLRDEHARERQRHRQERFIRNEMIGLASALSEEARTELLADLDQIEADVRGGGESARDGGIGGAFGSLAVAFRYLAERVKRQYQSLDKLVAELRDALATKTELIGLQQQFQIASQMQAAILPKTLPPRRDIEIEGRLLPAKEFGGNFYDFFLIDNDRLLIAAAEISGQGLATAFMTIVARTLLKATVAMDTTPGSALRRVNAMLLAENDQQLEIRVFLATLDLSSGRLAYASAGYPAPVVLRRLGDAGELVLAESAPLGILAEPPLAEGKLDLPARTTLVLASRGVEGALNPVGQPLGRAGMARALQASDTLEARAICNVLISTVTGHEMGRDRSNDASCIALRYLGR
jgi:sigma-B regulation protein RsbU (phosphoserine phosphatase)